MSTLDQIAAEQGDGVANQLCDFIDLTAQRDDLRNKLKEIEDRRSELERELIERFAMSGMQSVKINNCLLYTQVEQHASVKAECREAALEAAKALELEDLITIQPQRFAAWVREQLRDETTGHKLPVEFEGLVTIYEKASLRMRRS